MELRRTMKKPLGTNAPLVFALANHRQGDNFTHVNTKIAPAALRSHQQWDK